jgi:gas vesicle protein
MTETRVIRERGGGFFLGLVVGGLAGAAVGLLTAPRSGPETRTLLMDKGIEIRDQVETTARDVREQANSLAHDLNYKAREALDTTRTKAEEVIGTTKSKAETLLDTTKSKVYQRTSQIGHAVDAAKEAAEQSWSVDEKVAKLNA